MDIQKVIQSARFTKVLIGIGLAMSVLIIFEAGVFVGIHKAGTSFRMGDEYYRALGTGGQQGFFGEELSEAHGAAGQVLSVALPQFVVEENNNTEKVIVLGDQTVIRSFRSATSSNALAAGEFVIVIGEPNDKGQIDASLIRILPPPPTQ